MCKTMLSYCLKCRKNVKIKNLRVTKTNKGKQMLLSKLAVLNSIKSILIRKQETT